MRSFEMNSLRMAAFGVENRSNWYIFCWRGKDAKRREIDMRRCRHMPVPAVGPVEHSGRSFQQSIRRLTGKTCNGRPSRRPSRLPHGYGPAAPPRDAKYKESRAHHRSCGCCVVKLYNAFRPHSAMNWFAPKRTARREHPLNHTAI